MFLNLLKFVISSLSSFLPTAVFNYTSRVPVEGKSSVCLICMKYRIIILIIIIISVGQILLSYIANTSRMHARTQARSHAHTHTHMRARAHTSAHTHTPPSPPYRLSLFVGAQPLLYGSEAWATTLADRRRLDVFDMRSQRRLLRVFWQQHVSNQSIHQCRPVGLRQTPVEGLCLRTANARTRAWPLSQSKSTVMTRSAGDNVGRWPLK